MKTRSLASIALAAAAVLGTAGCGAVTTQATTIDYSPSDGVNVAVPDDAPVEILNALLVKGEESDTDANFVAALVNETESTQTVTLSWDGGSAAIKVPADSTASYGAGEELLLQNISAPAGATEDIVFQSGDSAGVTEAVQVFNTELSHLSTLAPEPPATADPEVVPGSGSADSDAATTDNAEDEAAGDASTGTAADTGTEDESAGDAADDKSADSDAAGDDTAE